MERLVRGKYWHTLYQVLSFQSKLFLFQPAGLDQLEAADENDRKTHVLGACTGAFYHGRRTWRPRLTHRKTSPGRKAHAEPQDTSHEPSEWSVRQFEFVLARRLRIAEFQAFVG